MTTQEKCDKTATAAIKVGKMSEFAPVCDDHIVHHRARSAKAGKKKATEMFTLPKGASAADRKKHEAAIQSFVGTNADDNIPIQVRPLSEIEKANNLKCCNHLIDAGA